MNRRKERTKQNTKRSSASDSWLKGKKRAVVDPTKNSSTSDWARTHSYLHSKTANKKAAGKKGGRKVRGPKMTHYAENKQRETECGQRR